jgi:hypothetical protein
MAGDFIPHQDGAFLEWTKTLLAYVALKLTVFNIPTENLTPIQGLLTAYETTAFSSAQNPNRGKVDVLTKNEAKEAFITALRTFIKGYLTYNPAVSDTFVPDGKITREIKAHWEKFIKQLSHKKYGGVFFTALFI